MVSNNISLLASVQSEPVTNNPQLIVSNIILSKIESKYNADIGSLLFGPQNSSSS